MDLNLLCHLGGLAAGAHLAAGAQRHRAVTHLQSDLAVELAASGPEREARVSTEVEQLVLILHEKKRPPSSVNLAEIRCKAAISARSRRACTLPTTKAATCFSLRSEVELLMMRPYLPYKEGGGKAATVLLLEESSS